MEPSNALRRRLREALEARAQSARDLSVKAGLNPDEVGRILESPHRVPRVDTLAKLCDVLDWRLADAVYWAVGREAPAAAAGEPERVILQQLARLGYSETRRKLILDLLQEWPRRAPSTES